MKIKILKSGFIFLVLLSAVSNLDMHTATGATAEYEIIAIKAYLFLNHKGTLSAEDVSGEWFLNLPIADDPEIASQTVMAIVEVKGEPGSFAGKRKIQFVAEEGRRIVLKQTVSIGLMSEEGKYYEAFILNDVGCSPLKMTARILGQSKISKKESIIDFQCGE